MDELFTSGVEASSSPISTPVDLSRRPGVDAKGSSADRRWPFPDRLVPVTGVSRKVRPRRQACYTVTPIVARQ